MKYKVFIDQWFYVEAEDAVEALEKADSGDIVYGEVNRIEATEVDEFCVSWDGDYG